MALPTSDLSTDDIRAALIMGSGVLTFKEMCEWYTVYASGLDNAYCPGVSPADRWANLKSTGAYIGNPYEIGKFRGYTHEDPNVSVGWNALGILSFTNLGTKTLAIVFKSEVAGNCEDSCGYTNYYYAIGTVSDINGTIISKEAAGNCDPYNGAGSGDLEATSATIYVSSGSAEITAYSDMNYAPSQCGDRWGHAWCKIVSVSSADPTVNITIPYSLWGMDNSNSPDRYA